MKITPVNNVSFKLGDATYNKADVLTFPNESKGEISLYIKNGTFSPPVEKSIPWRTLRDSNDDAFDSFADASAYLAAAAAVGGEAAPSTGTAVSNAVTISALKGIITTESLTAAAGATTTITVTNDQVEANSLVLITGQYASASAGIPVFRLGTVSAGSFTVLITNTHGSSALNAVAKIHFVVN